MHTVGIYIFVSERLMHHTLMGLDPPFAKGAEFTDALANQATTAGLLFTLVVTYNKVLYFSST